MHYKLLLHEILFDPIEYGQMYMFNFNPYVKDILDGTHIQFAIHFLTRNIREEKCATRTFFWFIFYFKKERFLQNQTTDLIVMFSEIKLGSISFSVLKYDYQELWKKNHHQFLSNKDFYHHQPNNHKQETQSFPINSVDLFQMKAYLSKMLPMLKQLLTITIKPNAFLV